jgi:hypothetical protein
MAAKLESLARRMRAFGAELLAVANDLDDAAKLLKGEGPERKP